MSQESQEQHKAFEFLSERYISQEPFTREQFKTATGFSDESFRTYLSKQFKYLLVNVDRDLYRVSLAFRQFSTWPKFRDNVVTQIRLLTRQYKTACYENVVMFEFYMPLRNEEYLHVALDSLFYKDSIKFRLKIIKEVELQKWFPKNTGEGNEDYYERICDWIGEKFVGYSINHVSGRFRIGKLKSKTEVFEQTGKNPDRYLVNETTAVVRFIFPCKALPFKLSGSSTSNVKDPVRLEADCIRWFFNQLFVQSILEVVNGEDEIWLLESGMQNQLHIFRVEE